MGAALGFAGARIRQRLGDGETPRDDGFFDAPEDGRAAAEELLEGVLLHAANAYEEAKLPYIGNIYANLVFRPDIAPEYAHYLLQLADRLTYRQLTLIATFENAPFNESLMYFDAEREEGGPTPPVGLDAEIDELARLGVLGRRNLEGVAERGFTYIGDGYATVGATQLGRDLYDLASLESIPIGTQQQVIVHLGARLRNGS